MQEPRANWFLTSGARELKRSSELSYQDYRCLSQSCRSSQLEEDLHQIELDLSRTGDSIRLFLLSQDDSKTYEECPSHVMEQYVPILRNILAAYSARNPRVGYVQGHADVLCFLLGNVNDKCDQEETFWVYASVIERIFPEDFFARTPKLHGFQVDCKLYHELVVRKLVPHHPILEKVHLSLVTTLLSCKWFVSLWVGEVPLAVLYEIWNAMLGEADGTILHLVVALHYFKLAIDKIKLYMETEQWDSSYIYKIILEQCQKTTEISPQLLLQEGRTLYGLRDEFVEDVRATLRRVPHLRKAEITALGKQTQFNELEIERLHDEFTFLRFQTRGCSRSKLRGLRQEEIERILAREYSTWPVESYGPIYRFLTPDWYGNVSFYSLLQFLSVASRGTMKDKARLLFQLVNQQQRDYLDQQGIEQLADLLASLLTNRMLADIGGHQVVKLWRNERLDFISGVAQSPLLTTQFRIKLQSIATSDGLLLSTDWLEYALEDSEIGQLMVWETTRRRSSGKKSLGKPRSPIQPTLGRALSDSLLVLHNTRDGTNERATSVTSFLEKCGSGNEKKLASDKQLTLLSRKMKKKLLACWPRSTTDELVRNPFEEPSDVTLYVFWCQCSIC